VGGHHRVEGITAVAQGLRRGFSGGGVTGGDCAAGWAVHARILSVAGWAERSLCRL